MIEDFRPAGTAIARTLREEGHEVEWVGSGREGIECLGSGTVDLIVLDLALPDQGGIEILERVKRDPATRLVPVIVVTGVDETEARAFAAGADAWFQKPAPPEALCARARVLIDTHQFLKARLGEAGDGPLRWSRFWAHDLRNLAAVVRANAQYLLAQRCSAPAGEEATQVLHDTLDSAERIVQLAHEMVTAERLCGGRLRLQRSEVQLGAMACKAASELRAVGRGPTVTVDGDACVQGDADLLHRVFLNLLGNALKHAEGTAVCIDIQRARGRVCVGVRDHGAGVTPAVREALVRPARVGADGHGLGLPFCRFVIEAHGGEMDVEPATGGGARFWFTLPDS